MNRSLLAIAGAIGLGAALPASAGATTVELGVSTTPLTAPTCPKGVAPAQCFIILTRATALETIRDNVAYPSTVKQAGRLVAFTVGLSALSSNPTTVQTTSSSSTRPTAATPRSRSPSSSASARRPSGRGRWSTQSPLVDVQPYLGQVVQFPLTTSLPVVRGETIALTTPTWAPVLSIDLSTDHFAYRQSRSRNCGHAAGHEPGAGDGRPEQPRTSVTTRARGSSTAPPRSPIRCRPRRPRPARRRRRS